MVTLTPSDTFRRRGPKPERPLGLSKFIRRNLIFTGVAVHVLFLLASPLIWFVAPGTIYFGAIPVLLALPICLYLACKAWSRESVLWTGGFVLAMAIPAAWMTFGAPLLAVRDAHDHFRQTTGLPKNAEILFHYDEGWNDRHLFAVVQYPAGEKIAWNIPNYRPLDPDAWSLLADMQRMAEVPLELRPDMAKKSMRYGGGPAGHGQWSNLVIVDLETNRRWILETTQ